MLLKLIIFTLGLSRAFAAPLEFKTMSTAGILKNSVRIGIQNPDGAPVGDILFLPGFGDRLDNHGPLFEEWVKKGFRVISFDYPSHGGTTGSPLNFFSFRRLAKMVRAVEEFTRSEADRPLILSGWSIGGMIAARIASSDTLARPGRPIKGLILFAPAIATPFRVGEASSWLFPMGRVTSETLTHDPNPPHRGSIRPDTPLSVFPFPIFLKINTLFALNQKLPPSLPTLVFLSDAHEEKYVDMKRVELWLAWQRRVSADVKSVDLFGARHEIDNELTEFGSDYARVEAAKFAAQIAHNTACELALAKP